MNVQRLMQQLQDPLNSWWWLLFGLQVAMSGDFDAMVRVSHMLMAGYGTQQDHAAAAAWMRQAW